MKLQRVTPHQQLGLARLFPKGHIQLLKRALTTSLHSEDTQMWRGDSEAPRLCSAFVSQSEVVTDTALSQNTSDWELDKFSLLPFDF